MEGVDLHRHLCPELRLGRLQVAHPRVSREVHTASILMIAWGHANVPASA